MTDTLLVFALLALTAALSIPVAVLLGRALDTTGDRLDAVLDRALGPRRFQDLRGYLVALFLFNATLFAVAWLVFAFQGSLPLNPDAIGGMPPDLAFHTASSFTTNTNLQHYSGEVALSYLSQILGVGWLQFTSAASGIACLAALARGLRGERHDGRLTLGDFNRDVARVVVLVFLPLSLVVALLLIVGGTPMTLEGAAVAETLEGSLQRIARGPVAAIVAIKQLGTNGGGYFGPNSTHPFENPSLFTAFVEASAILLIPMACVWLFGRMTRRPGDARVIFAAMTALFLLFSIPATQLELTPSAAVAGLDVAAGPNLEGKELRFGEAVGSFWAVATTSTSNGSVAAMHDSLQPLTGLIALGGMFLSCIYGGVGVGMINMFLYVILAVFLAGTMVGRTPEYLGRKVEAREMTLATLALLLPPLLILGGTAVFAATDLGASTTSNPGPHGFSQILYEMSSAAANNGSGFEGLGDDTVAWNLVTGLWMMLGRYLPIVLPLAIAWNLGGKRLVPETSGTLRTNTFVFGAFLVGSVLLLGALLFLPAAVLGPVAEHLRLG